MINIHFTPHGFISEGHAEYAERGADIVCSAVSAILHTTELGLRQVSAVKTVARSGYMETNIPKSDNYTTILLYSAYLGLKEIEKQYPERVNVKMEGKE